MGTKLSDLVRFPQGIAAQALACECVLVTANVVEFSRVASLEVENWLDS
jgi:predicted nucleic acid-binding protein